MDIFRAHCCAPILPSVCPHAPSCWGGPRAGFPTELPEVDCRATPRSSHRSSNKILFTKSFSLIPELGRDEEFREGWRRQKTNPGPPSPPCGRDLLREPRAGGQTARGACSGRFPVLGRVRAVLYVYLWEQGWDLGRPLLLWFIHIFKESFFPLQAHLARVWFPSAEYRSSAGPLPSGTHPPAVNHG